MATKKPASSAKSSKKSNSNHLWSVVLFALGVLLLAIALISGESAWLVIHNILFGLFGPTAFLVPLVVIYAAIMIAQDKAEKAIWNKMIQGIVLLLLASSFVQVVIVGSVDGIDFVDKIINLYNDGMEFHSGGLLSAILGWPLLLLFKRTGATIIIVLLIFVFTMLLTNISLMDFLGLFLKPFKKAKEAAKESKDNSTEKTKKEKLPPNEPMPTVAKNPKLENIDIPILSIKNDIKPVEANPDDAAITPEPSPIPTVAPKAKKNTEKVKIEEKLKSANTDLDALIKKATEEAPAPAVPAEILPAATAAEEEFVPPIIDENGQTGLYVQDKKIGYIKPPISLLTPPKGQVMNENASAELKQNADTLVDTLKSFGVQTRIVDIHRGPTVTRYELQPSAGVKISKITGLADDIALNLAAAGVRIEAPIPGKAAVGIEVPNKNVDIVTMRELVETKDFDDAKSKVSFALGRDIAGNVVIADIAKMPHVLIAGSTGSGKSVCINSIIMSLLYKSSPEEVRILMIDPKVVELGIYNGIPHLLIPVVTDPRKAAGALSWAVNEMLKRYKLFADNNVRDLVGYNEFAKNTDGITTLPQIVIIIDELADLMMAAPSEVEDSVCRLAQMARAAGMHLVIATQRPSVDIITGVIKANIPSRIAFAVSSQVDSRTILDGAGAEKLLGRGDMLFYPSGKPKPLRVQGCFVTDKEVENVVNYIKNELKADYDNEIIEEIEKNVPAEKGASTTGGTSTDAVDEMVEKAIDVVLEAGQASTSYLQRRLKLGYARAARIIDELEEMGIVGPFEGAKPRTILMSKEQWCERKMRAEHPNQE